MAENSRYLQTEHTAHTRRTQEDANVLRRVIENHKASLKKRFQNISEGIFKPGADTLLSEIHTELYITEGDSEGLNMKNVWQEESVSRAQTTEDTAINCNDIFKLLPGQEKYIRTVMTKGFAGIGKTVCAQKFIRNWIDGVANEDVDFMFPFSFRELNLVKNHQCSLHSLLLSFYPHLKELKDDEYKCCQVVFIFDGLNESQWKMKFKQNKYLSNIKQSTSVSVLIANLILGTLLPSALIWITSRPAAASQIPAQYIDRITEISGFSNPQVEEYFRKRIIDENQSNKIISHIKASRSFRIMCHFPVFCWIAVPVLQEMLEQDNSQQIPQTLTEMFIHFLLIQTTRKNQVYLSGTDINTEKDPESHKHILLKLSELAFKNLESGNLMFYAEDLKECGIDVNKASVYSGLCTEIFKEESVFHQRKVYSFVHLSIQEFLAAVFVFHSYVTENLKPLRSLISEEHKGKSVLSCLQSALGLKTQIHVLLKSVVDVALKRRNGNLDLFLRFLMGISLESNQTLLQGLLSKIHTTTKSIKETCQYIKLLNREGLSPESYITLFHCLFEMNDHSIHKEIQKMLSAPKYLKQKLSPAHCSALAHMLLMSEEILDEFDLKKYNTSDEGCWRLIPVMRCCRKARIADCRLTNRSCGIMSTLLQSPNCLIELDLSQNNIGDPGIQLLFKALSSPHCKLQTLRLTDCELTHKSCELVASVLQLPNQLKDLDLSRNDLGDIGVQLLSKALSTSHGKLQSLRLPDCKVTDKSCEILASVLQSPNSLIEVDLSQNDLGDSGVHLLFKGLSSSHCKLQSLRLSDCKLSDRFCGIVASVLQTPNSLIELDLSHNDLGDAGAHLFSKGLYSSHCRLLMLRFADCKLTEKSCEIVASILQSPNSLKELDLSHNDLGDSGVQLLSIGFSNQHCKLQILRLSDCLISDKGCVCLSSALTSNPSHLKELDLSLNHFGESGLKLLSGRLEDPSCKLEILKPDHASLHRARPRLMKYSCKLTVDPNTVHRLLSISDGNRNVTRTWEEQLYPLHPQRFECWSQVLCREGLSGRCYWEVEWRGVNGARIAVAYKSIKRKGGNDNILLGNNDKSWSILCCPDVHSARHNNEHTGIDLPAPYSGSRRVGVYLDWPAGTLSFYSVSCTTLIHLHTFHSTFTEPLYPGFGVYCDSSVSLCQII